MIDETEELAPAKPHRVPKEKTGTVALYLRTEIRGKFYAMLTKAKSKGWFTPRADTNEEAQFVAWLITESYADKYGQYTWPDHTRHL
jgi:hypothetical protein